MLEKILFGITRLDAAKEIMHQEIIKTIREDLQWRSETLGTKVDLLAHNGDDASMD